MPEAIEEQLDMEQYRKFWISNSKRGKLFNLMIQGKSIPEIQIEAHTQLDFIKKTTSSPFFLKRLETYLLQVLFNYQVNRILALDEVFKLYWDVATGKKSIDGLSVGEASKHLVKLLELRGEQVKVINPKQYNIIMNILKAGPEKFKDMAKEFGFEKLKVSKDEGPDSNLKLGGGEGSQNQ